MGKKQIEKTEKILKALKLIDTPAMLKEFEEDVEKYVKTWAECKDVDLRWDENPHTVSKKLDDDVVYRKEYHIDVIVCDGEEYEIEATYEFYDADYAFIVHSFNPVDVKKR
jgi:hypothetical protein